LMAGLPIISWIRFFLWLTIGLCLYYFYGRRHSQLATQKPGEPLTGGEKL
jgi:APA family basic amino acid/polyamine antiporter